MTIRIDVSRLPEDVAEALRSGELVEFEDEGEVVRRVEEKKPLNWEAFFAARANALPLDYDDFIADVEEVRRELNQPFEDRWPS